MMMIMIVGGRRWTAMIVGAWDGDERLMWWWWCVGNTPLGKRVEEEHVGLGLGIVGVRVSCYVYVGVIRVHQVKCLHVFLDF